VQLPISDPLVNTNDVPVSTNKHDRKKRKRDIPTDSSPEKDSRNRLPVVLLVEKSHFA